MDPNNQQTVTAPTSPAPDVGSHRPTSDVRRVALAIGLTGIAMAAPLAYTASQLGAGADLTAPIAYVPFVPVVATVAAKQRWLGTTDESRQRAHRAADWIVAAGLAFAAYVVGRSFPQAFTTETLTWRGDLAALPLVAAAVTVLIFGLRMLWRLRTVLWFLSLMSPAWYRPAISAIRRATGASTNLAVRAMSDVLPMVTATRTVNGGVDVDIAGPSETVTLRVVEVCAGHGAVIAGCFMAASMWLLAQGPRRSKLQWSALIIVLCWVGNLVRLAALFFATALVDDSAANGWFHDVIGGTTLVGALVVALGLATRLGLSPRPVARESSVALQAQRECEPAPPPNSWFGLDGVALVVGVIFAAVMFTVTNTATQSFDLMAGRSDEALAPIAPVLNGWTSAQDGSATPELPLIKHENVTWAAQYFGQSARWERYISRPNDSASVIGIDVVSTSQPSLLDTYGISACLGFHGWRMDHNEIVEMAGGRHAEQIVYTVRGVVGQEQASTPGGETRSIAVLAWRQRVSNGRTERIMLQQQQPVGDWSMADLEAVALELMTHTDQATPR